MSTLRHLGINAVFLSPPMGGLETYTRALVPELVRARPGLRVSVFANPGAAPSLRAEPWGDAVRVVTHPLLGRRGLKAASELTLLGALADHRGVDVLHSVALTAPLRLRAANVVTLADVTWIVAPERGERFTVALWRVVVPPVARRADRVIAISHAGADHVVEHLGVPRERIDVVHLGHGVERHPAPTAEREVRARHGLGAGPLILTVSAKKAHKNLLRLVQAMPAVRAAVPDAVLVLVGAPTPHERELREEADRLGIADALRWPPYVDREDLEGLYGAARASVVASVNEGFGLPVLEAMERGVAVACSNVSALPEVAGDAARLFDPYDVGDIARALVALLTDDALRARLVAAGRERVRAFSWEAAAAGTLESYERALAARG